MEKLRRAAVAGSWYPGTPERLAADVDRYIAGAGVEPLPHVRAIVAPHAGLMYSGPVAAFSYDVARKTRYSTIVLVGPSHYVPFRGVSIWPRGAWETPFGPVPIDEPVAAAITEAAPAVIVDRADAHGREHSLELQLPFVAHLWPGAAIVPLVMGHQTRETAEALGDAIAAAVSRGSQVSSTNDLRPQFPGDVLLVASSDLSHYEDATTAAAMDTVVMRHVEALDADGLMTTLHREPRHACGGGPIVSVLRAARQLGATQARLLHYADSGDVSGDKSSVVGYMAAAIW
jgi:AmmeMemoRadiSam system protein B